MLSGRVSLEVVGSKNAICRKKNCRLKATRRGIELLVGGKLRILIVVKNFPILTKLIIFGQRNKVTPQVSSGVDLKKIVLNYCARHPAF